MLNESLPSALAVSLSMMFGVAALVQLAGPGFVRRAYEHWGFPRNFFRVTGLIELLTAMFLAVPQTRIWGVMLAYLVTFVSVVTLLAHRQYAWSAPGMLIMVALVPVTLAAPAWVD